MKPVSLEEANKLEKHHPTTKHFRSEPFFNQFQTSYFFLYATRKFHVFRPLVDPDLVPEPSPVSIKICTFGSGTYSFRNSSTCSRRALSSMMHTCRLLSTFIPTYSNIIVGDCSQKYQTKLIGAAESLFLALPPKTCLKIRGSDNQRKSLLVKTCQESRW